jgi:selenium metabolism protein YedF
VLHATKTEGAEAVSVQTAKKVVVLIDGATVGRGDDVLGAVLMKSFLHTLKEISPRPWRLIFINAGVKLAAEGSDLANVLSELESLGIEILSCGICLDFFKLKEKLRAGKVTNMYEIVSSLVAATNVIRP